MASVLHSDSASWVWVFAHVPSPVSGVACIQSPKLSSLAADSVDEDNNFASSLEFFAAKLAQQLLTEHVWAGTVTVFHQLPVSDDTGQSFHHNRCEAHLPAAGPGWSVRADAGQERPIGGYRLHKPVPEHQLNLLWTMQMCWRAISSRRICKD